MANQRRYTIKTLSHCFYHCNYHLVFTPKYRGKIFIQPYVKQEVKHLIKIVCEWKKFEAVEINVQDDHVHMVVSIDPRHSVSYALSIIKGKSSKWIKKKNKKLAGLCHKGSLWARGYFVSTIGCDEEIIKRYVKHQSKHDQVDQPSLWDTPENR